MDSMLNFDANNSPMASEILVESNNFARTIILNRPKQLNATSYGMLSQLLELFISYEDDRNVKLVIVKGTGKAFCAGGDVAVIAQLCKFFWDEFGLSYVIATFKKTQVSILNGYVMGAGSWIATHGRFRVVTENTVFSLPETSLGISTDAGGSYYLPRIPGSFGVYLALTGARLDGSEMIACGLATHFVSASKLESLEEALMQVNTSDPRVISIIIDEFSQRPDLNPESAYNSLDVIDKCFSKGTIEEILSALQTESENKPNEEWLLRAIQWMKKASPIALKFTLRSMQKGSTEDIAQCHIREYRLNSHILRKDVSGDFFEGCRAVLIEKDKNPKWQPSCLEDISDEMVEYYFTKVDARGWEDLRLYTRPQQSVSVVARL
ncbi:3-hydroxyisobutyryl-CoA hydrolase [Ranunculus cassubicifolius]